MKQQLRKGIVQKCMFLLAFLLCSTMAFAQQRVSGTVVDQSGEPLIGVSVLPQGQTQGVVTDIDGKYVINVPAGVKALDFRLVGYVPQTATISGATVNVVLKEDHKLLDDVVVIGYGSMTRKDVTSSISTVKAEDMNVGIYTDPAQLLQGKVPGLVVTQSSDPNGGTASINLRGASTLNGATSPLYVVDGIAGVDLSLIAPEDIESIDVLRDASATAIYGSKAANGVIMITTKKGEEGRTNISYSGYVSWEKLVKKLDVLTADELRSFAAANDITIPNDQGASTVWADEATHTGFAHNHNLAISGGNKTATFTASVNYMERDGIVKGTGMDRFIARAMVSDKTLKDRLTFTLGVNGSISNHWGVPTGQEGLSTYDAMYYFSPLVPVTYEDGTWGAYTAQSQNYNPMSLIYENKSRSTNKRIQAMGKVSIKIIEGLFLNGNFNYQNQNYGYKAYTTTQTQTLDAGKHGVATRETTESIMKSMEIYANYDNTFADVHKISLMAGYSWEQQDNGDGFGASSYNYYDDAIGWNNIGLGNRHDMSDFWGKTKSVLRMISFYGRANYSYDGKYIVQAAVRRDGSSAFGGNNRWATFPSASAAWRIAEEDFLKDTGIFNDLKVRVGWGKSGNSAGFDAFTSQFYYGPSGWFNYTDGYAYRTLGAWRNANPNLKWETTATWNFGIDYAFFNSRLHGTIEYYIKDTKDMIFDYGVSTTRYPVNWMTANVGQMKNRGIEFSINAIPVQTRDFSWSTDINITHNKNEVTKISNEQYSVDYVDEWNPNVKGFSIGPGSQIQRIMEGQPIGTFYMWEWAGINEDGQSTYYVHDPETGERTGEVTTQPGDTDRTICGNAQPKLNLGWNNTLTYKNFTLNAFFTGTFGNKVYNEWRNAYFFPGLISEGKNVLAECATKENLRDAYAGAPSNRFLENGSYFKLASLTLGYTFNNCFDGWLNSIHLYATCNNVFTITKYKGIDPEIGLGSITPGIDTRRTQYPRARSFVVGATINF